MAAKAGGPKKDDGRGRFFAIQREAWMALCRESSLNEAVAYLVLARGSNFGVRTSAWSVDAIERYTGIARARAKNALQGLLKAGWLVQRRGGTKPLYYLPTAAETARMYAPGKVLSLKEREVFDKVKSGKEAMAPSGDPAEPESEAAIAADLAGREILMPLDRGEYVTDPDLDLISAADWIWLPNSLVDGVDGRTSPVEQIRQTQDRLTLHLLVDLFHCQSLAFNGGVHWRMAREEYEKIRLGQQGAHEVWGFRSLGTTCWHTAPFVAPHLTGEVGADGESDTGFTAVAKALSNLRALRLVQLVPHLIDADTDEGEVIHPCPLAGAEAQEVAVGIAALEAAEAMLTEPQIWRAEEMKVTLMLPIPRHRGHATVVGLLRTTHRAQTAATADWMGNAPDWAEWVRTYNQLGPI